MTKRNISTGVLLAAARGALLCCGIFLLELRNGGAGKVFPFSLIAYSAVMFLYNALILRKDRTVTVLVCLNIAVGAAYFIAVSFLQPWRSLGQAVASLAVITVLTVQEAKENLAPIALHSVVLAADISFYGLAASVAVLYGVDYSAQWALCAIIGAVCAFAALLSYRLDTLSRAGKIGVLSVGAAAGLVITLAASQRLASAVGRAIMAVWNAIVAALAFIADCLERFMLWLASFAPEIEGDIELEAVEELDLPKEETVLEGWDMTWLLYTLAALAAVAAIVFIIKKKKTRVSAGTRVSSAKITSEKVGFGFALRKLFEKLRAAARLAMALRRKRKTPAGVYLRISGCAVRPRKSETAKEYLMRLSAHECVRPRESAALKELGEAVNRQIYSPRGEETFSRTGELRFFKTRLRVRIFAGYIRALYAR